MILAAIFTILAVVIGFVFYLQHCRTRSKDHELEQRRKERAKASFQVRRSNLMAVSGRGNKHKRQKKNGRNSSERNTQQNQQIKSSPFLVSKFVVLVRQISTYLVNKLSCGLFQSETKAPLHSTNSQTKSAVAINMRGYYDNIKVVGLDCEMVGSGRGGWKSLLARCSVVTLDCIPVDFLADEANATTKPKNMNENLVVLYDKYVIPKGKVSDYRTQWSGITKDTYSSNNTGDENSIPIVSFQQCQKEISELLSSIDGKSVVVVGHALDNDFDALEMKVSLINAMQ